MATRTVWSKGGLKLACDVSDLPAPRPKQVFPLPDLTTAAYPFVTLSLDELNRSVVAVIDANLPSGAGEWWLHWNTATATRLAPVRVAAGGRAEIHNALPYEPYTAYLSRTDAGSNVTTYASRSITTTAAYALASDADVQTALTPSVVADGVTTQFLHTGPTVTCEDWRGVWTLSAAPRTNLIKQSKAYDNSAWTKFANGLATLPVVTANAGLAPDGTMTADRITFNRGGSASTDICTVIQNVTGQTVGNPYAPSLWLKSNTGADQHVMIYWSGLATGKGGGTITNVVTVTPDWQRFSCADLAANATLAVQFGCRVSYGDQTLDILAWEAQVETGTAPTPNITTGASAVTQTDITTANGLATLSPAPLKGAILRGVSSNAAQAAALAIPAIVTDHAAISLPNASYPPARLVYQTGGTPAGTFWQVNAAGTGWQTPSLGVAQLVGQIIAAQIAAGAIDVGHLAASLAIVGVIKSGGSGAVYNGTSSVKSTLGFKISGVPFTAMGADGVTHDVSADFSGPVMIAGRKAATITDRVFQPFNRLRNGSFAYSREPWGGGGEWVTDSSTANTGSIRIKGAPSGTPGTFVGSVTQTFTVPSNPGTVSLTVKDGLRVTGNTYGATISHTLKAYVLDVSTGTETLVATWSGTYGSSLDLPLTWTDRSVDISSYLSGGDFGLRLEMTLVNDYRVDLMEMFVDSVSIVI